MEYILDDIVKWNESYKLVLKENQQKVKLNMKHNG